MGIDQIFILKVIRSVSAAFGCSLADLPNRLPGPPLGACLSIPREPRWQGHVSVRCSWAWPTTSDRCRGADARRAAPPVVVPRASRATPQTPHRTDPMACQDPTVAHEQRALPTLRDRADFPSCGVVASLLGIYPTSSAPPCLRGNLPRSRPRGILRQAPSPRRCAWPLRDTTARCVWACVPES